MVVKKKKKTALITGASRGIGRAIALTLGRAGYRVGINYLKNEDEAREVGVRVEQNGGSAFILKADVNNPEDRERMVIECLHRYNGLDILVNNAGITMDNLLIRMSQEEWQRVISTNLISAVHLTELAAEKILKHSNHGKIINISSVVGIHGNAGQTNYAAAKAGMIALTKIKARELMPYIQVNCIAPGLVSTDMTAKFDLAKLADSRLGKAAQPADISEIVFALTESDYITGQVIEVDGGLSLWSDVRDLALPMVSAART